MVYTVIIKRGFLPESFALPYRIATRGSLKLIVNRYSDVCF